MNPRDRRVVVIESVLCPSHFRETLTRVLFKSFEVPVTYVVVFGGYSKLNLKDPYLFSSLYVLQSAVEEPDDRVNRSFLKSTIYFLSLYGYFMHS